MSTPPSKGKPAQAKATSRRRVKLLGKRWKLYALVALAGPLVVFLGVLGYYYVVFSRMIDARLHGDMQRVDPAGLRQAVRGPAEASPCRPGSSSTG